MLQMVLSQHIYPIYPNLYAVHFPLNHCFHRLEQLNKVKKMNIYQKEGQNQNSL